MSRWDRFTETFFNGKVMAKYLPDILAGVVVTIELAVLVVVTGIAAGLALALLAEPRHPPAQLADHRRRRPVPLAATAGGHRADLLRAAQRRAVPSGFVATWLSLALVQMAFSEEIFWAGITSVARGQWEAARSTGLSFGQTLMNVVLPQAVRLTIPPLTNRTIAITKGTALGTVVASPRSWARPARPCPTPTTPPR
jgi:polar amino acid transport system permease protein